MGEGGSVGVWEQEKGPELGGGPVYTLILPWNGCVTSGQGCTSLILGIPAP